MSAAAGFEGTYPFFHRGATTLHFLEPIAVGTDPTISPGWARPLGWRVATADGVSAWDKTGPADTDWTAISAGPGAGISEITSDDGTVTVNNPTGPTVDLSVVHFDVTLSYGQGVAADREFPTGGVFWLSPQCNADLTDEIGEEGPAVREWETQDPLTVLELSFNVDVLTLPNDVSLPFIVTVNGVDSPLVVSLGTVGFGGQNSVIPCDPGDRIGVRVDGTGTAEGTLMRGTFRIKGY